MSPNELRLVLPPDKSLGLAHLARVAEELRGFLDRLGVGPRAAYRAEVVLEELVTNVIKYGLEECLEGEGVASHAEVQVRCRVELEELILVVEDPGPPFDPTAHDGRALTPDDALDEVQPGGLGLHMVRSLCARVLYERRGRTNLIRACIALDG